MIFRYSHRKGPCWSSHWKSGAQFPGYIFLLSQFGLISGRCGRFNRRKTMRIWWSMPQFWDSQAFWLKRNIPVKKWHFQNCAFFCCFFGICFFWPFGWVGMLLSLTQSSSIWPGVAAHPFGISEFLESGSGKCIFIPQLYTDLYLWRDVRKLVFHSILSHLVNLVKVSDSGRIHSSLQKTKHQAWKGLLSKDWNAQIRGKEETFTSSSSTEFVL